MPNDLRTLTRAAVAPRAADSQICNLTRHGSGSPTDAHRGHLYFWLHLPGTLETQRATWKNRI